MRATPTIKRPLKENKPWSFGIKKILISLMNDEIKDYVE
jgi:hypothetical protein